MLRGEVCLRIALQIVVSKVSKHREFEGRYRWYKWSSLCPSTLTGYRCFRCESLKGSSVGEACLTESPLTT
eukprot:12238-Heterococcus_DN1.PRE.4